jgi:hypothetical protein
MGAELDKSRKRVRVLREALEFYADEDHWVTAISGLSVAALNKGKIARAALRGEEEQMSKEHTIYRSLYAIGQQVSMPLMGDTTCTVEAVRFTESKVKYDLLVESPEGPTVIYNVDGALLEER